MMVTTNITTLSKVKLSMNKMDKETILVIPTTTHKHKTNILEKQMKLIKITMTMTTAMMTTMMTDDNKNQNQSGNNNNQVADDDESYNDPDIYDGIQRITYKIIMTPQETRVMILKLRNLKMMITLMDLKMMIIMIQMTSIKLKKKLL